MGRKKLQKNITDEKLQTIPESKPTEQLPIPKKRGRPSKKINKEPEVIKTEQWNEINKPKDPIKVTVKEFESLNKNKIPEFNNINELIIYSKQNTGTNFSIDEALKLIKELSKLINDIVTKNMTYHLEKFTRYKIEKLTQEQQDDYECRLGFFNVYIFMEEYFQPFKNYNELFKSTYDKFKSGYEVFKEKTEFIAKSDKVIMYKYYN